MNAPPFLVLALGAALLVVLVDRVAKHVVGPRGGGRSRRARASHRVLELHRSLHVRGVHPHRLWGGARGAAVVLLAIAVGLGVLHEWLGEVATGPLLAASVALGGAASNVLDLRRHGGIVNCATVGWVRGGVWGGRRLAFNLADVAIVGGVIVSLLLALGPSLGVGAIPWW